MGTLWAELITQAVGLDIIIIIIIIIIPIRLLYAYLYGYRLGSGGINRSSPCSVTGRFKMKKNSVWYDG